MNELKGIEDILVCLGMEILTVHVGSNDGQSTILDLFRRLGELANKSRANHELIENAERGRERMSSIISSGEPFSPADVKWLRKLLTTVQASAKFEAASEGTPNQLAEDESGSNTESDLPLMLNLSVDLDLLLDFSTEIREHLDNIEEGVLILESRPDDRETLDTIFRAFHTTKGSAGFLNLLPINRLSHVLESLLELTRRKKLTIDKHVIDLILRGKDVLKIFQYEIDERLGGKKIDQPIVVPTQALMSDVQALIDTVDTDENGTPKHVGGEESCGETPDSESAIGEGRKTMAISLAAETAPEEQQASKDWSDETTGTAKRVEHNRAVKVDTGKLDALLDLVGEMVITQSQVSTSVGDISKENPQCSRQLVQLSRITKELQRLSMSIRMVPIRGAFSRMARVVRDIASKQNKRVRLLTEGEDTELDRSIVEQLHDPLLHIIRNSMDHGIETPEVRLENGKLEVGTIYLRAYHQGGNVIIEIEDDGSGLNRDRIRSKAVELGLSGKDAELNDETVFGFIFHPGFSTSERVTDFSGRGVGLDVVRRNLESLRGSIYVSSDQGKGTRFKLSLPLTLAIINGLVVRVGNEQFIIPSISVSESFRPHANMLTTIQGQGEIVNVRGRLIPLMRLHHEFDIKSDFTNPTECICVVIEAGSNSRCILVDALVTQQEVVIKNLNDLMAYRNRFLAGAAILSDGRVGLILDANSIVNPQQKNFLKTA